MRAPIQILSVEDNPADRTLIQQFLAANRKGCKVHFAVDGQECMDFLKKRGRFRSAPKPDLILLDLNLPKKSGHEALKEIRSDKNTKKIPVVVLSTSNAAEDISQVYDLQANCYLVKPSELSEFVDMMNLIHDFWVTTAQLPA